MRHLAAALCAAIAAAGTTGAQGLQVDRVFGAGPAARLAEAAASGDAARVAELVAQGADIDARGHDDVTLLQWALLHRSSVGLRALLAAGADTARAGVDGASVLHLAAAAEDPAYLKLLLARPARVDVPHARTGATPLMAALMAGRAAQVRLLLDGGARLDATDRQGDTALHVAAKINDAGSALLLLQAGADPQARNQRGATFQRYLALTPERVLDATALAQRRALRAWLETHGIATEFS